MMDGFSLFCLLLAGGGVIFGLVQRLRARRQLAQVDRMLEIHTPRERMSISSVQRVWAFLLEVLKRSK